MKYLDLTMALYPKLAQISLPKSNSDESVISLEEDEGGDKHYVGGFSVIGPNMSINLTLLRAFNKIWEPPFNFVFLNNSNINKVDMLAYIL